MEALVNNNIFSDYKVGRIELVIISRLHFVDDTLIFGEKS